jgi:hypothetical protein
MSEIDKIKRHLGKHLDAFETQSDEILAEMFSKTARDSATFENGLIDRWEEEFAILEPAALLADRRDEVNANVRAVGGDDFDYFKNIAEGLGYNVDSATDPHLRITDGDFPPARADFARADTSRIWDQDPGNSRLTWCVRGTAVESDTVLHGIFDKQKATGTEVIYINE